MKEKRNKSKHSKSKDRERKSKRRSPSVSSFLCFSYYIGTLQYFKVAKVFISIISDICFLLVIFSQNSTTFNLQSSSSSGSESDEWVEQETRKTNEAQREDWMSMTGMLKTYTKEDIRPKREEKEKKNIDSYNPGTSSRELNPYWKNGGTGIPQTPDEYRKSRPFIKPSNDDDDYYSKSRSSRPSTSDRHSSRSSYEKPREHYNDRRDSYHTSNRNSSNWRKPSENRDRSHGTEREAREELLVHESKEKYTEKIPVTQEKPKDNQYLSDDKMNKLGAKIVKAEILGDHKLVAELKSKLEAAREYRKQNPDAGKEIEDDRVMLISTNLSGNSRPLTSSDKGDPRSRSGKRKAETHVSGERTKYFGDDDKYNLAQMVRYVFF